MRKCHALAFAAVVVCAVAAFLLYSTPLQAQQTSGSPAGRLVNRNADGSVNVDVESWRRNTETNHAPKHGCFTKSYPADTWTEVTCGQVDPRIVAAPTEGYYDHLTEVSGTTISQADAYVTPIVNPQSEYDLQTNTANSYSLQMNSNSHFSTPACNNHPGCTGWQQFIYSSAVVKAVFMQYWLFNYGTCESGWYQATGTTNCYKDSPMMSVPTQPVTNLVNLQFQGYSYCPDSRDNVSLYVAGPGTPTYYTVDAASNVLDLCQNWNTAGFNVIGDMSYTEAFFNPTGPAAEFGIWDYITTANGAYTNPTCGDTTVDGNDVQGISGESNNMIVSTECDVNPEGPPDPPTALPVTYYTETASYLIPNGTYYIQSPNSSMDLSDPNSSKTNGQDMEQLYQTLASNQIWTVTNIGGTKNVIYLINKASGLALDVSGDSKNNGALVDQWPYGGTGGTNQQWNVILVPGCTCFELTSVHSGLALETVGGSTTNGAKIDQNPYAGKTWQQWFFFAH